MMAQPGSVDTHGRHQAGAVQLPTLIVGVAAVATSTPAIADRAKSCPSILII